MPTPWFREPRILLLLDFSSAVVTSLLAALLLATAILPTGLPTWILYSMSLSAAGFALFDVVSVLRVSDRVRPLFAIGWLNLLYCAGTIVICVMFRSSVTYLGWMYFMLEGVLVIALACWELKIARWYPDFQIAKIK
jgi:hypothetical protein